HPRQVRLDLILLDITAISHNVGNAGNRLELPGDRPVLKCSQLCWRCVSLQPISIDFAYRCCQRTKVGRNTWRQVHVAQPFEHLLPREVSIHSIIERYSNERQTELRVRKQPYRVRNSTQADFEGDRDLLFDFFGSTAWKKGNDLHLGVRYIRKCFDRQGTK